MKSYKDLLSDAESLFRDTSKNVSRSSSDDTTKLIAVAALGLVVGGVLGILFAPSAGSETRSSIAGSVNDLSGTVRDKARQGVDKLSELKNQAVDTVKSRINGKAESEPMA